ncbi:auxin-responsive protein SAUR76-like [Rhododendron vialii]|uniref:auxin-responsive protein SAUR76-like n=1 Tax=Rhododendron vialii TaxID=182163 RepID=UPI00265EAA09|nr:auxin-responsive protein SAUR76-like [Rhododendron vialii]
MMGAKKLTKLKSALKKLPSSFTNRNNNDSNSTTGESEATGKLHPVYVGKSRRPYLVSSDVIDHPLFQVLVDKSNGGCDGGIISVDCEVVLFDHLLWVLENADSYLVSVGELVEFYTSTY